MAERPEACADWREDLAGWLVAQIEPDREAALLAHLPTCPACRDEADGLLSVVAVSLAADPDPAADRDLALTAADVEAPPLDLGDRIATRIAGERRRRSLRRGLLVAVGSAAAAVVVVVSVVVVTDDDLAPLEGTEFAFTVGDGAAVVAPDPDTGGSIVELEATGLDPEVTYALWLSVPGGGRDERVPAGTFQPDADGDVEVRLLSPMPAEAAGRVWATTPDRDLALDTE